MNGVGVGDFGGGNQVRNLQVAVARRGWANAHRLVSEAHVQGIAVGLRIHGDGLDAHLAAGANDAHGDFTAVRDENFLNHGGAN